MLSPTPASRSFRACLASLVAVSTPLVLAGCHTGGDAQTSQLYTAPSGTDVRSGDVKVLNALVVDNEDGTGLLVAGLVNGTDEADVLASVSATDPDAEDENAEITVREPETAIDLPPQRLVQLADPELVETSSILLEGEAVEPGQVVEVTLTFERAGSVTAQVPVVPRELAWATVATPPPPPEPAPEATEATKAEPRDGGGAGRGGGGNGGGGRGGG